MESTFFKFIVHFLLATSFAASFIALFFFTYAKDVERTIVVNNVKYVVSSLLSDFLKLIPAPFKKILSDQIDTINFTNMKEEDEHVTEANSKLLYSSIKLYGIILIVSFILAYMIARTNNINFEDILISNIIILFVIGLTEYLFLNHVIANYVSADPNKIKHAIIQTL